ncbi:hypothetical protein [Moorena producens]|uniref:hypothetical protein n=1 Tax=Moorena producens TaxID=1155739 RepID=UPI003C7323AC
MLFFPVPYSLFPNRSAPEAEALAFRPRYANGHALRSRSVGFAETLPLSAKSERINYSLVIENIEQLSYQ